jgi:hypothetical protein
MQAAFDISQTRKRERTIAVRRYRGRAKSA